MKKGFTLIELLIVVSIIGVLAVVLIPNINGAPSRARDADRISTVNDIIAAAESYYIDNDAYPLTGEDDDTMCIGPVAPMMPVGNPASDESSEEAAFISEYLGGQAPSSSSIFETPVYCDDGDNSYYIYSKGSGLDYWVGVMLENGRSDTVELPTNETGVNANLYMVKR